MEQGAKGGDSNQSHNQRRQSKEVEINPAAPHQPPPPRKCPRCESLNTKFCYYNNYNMSQPRYFCKNCRRYWTHGGTLRNVPVGGSSRKGKRGRVSPVACGGEGGSRSRPFLPPRPQQGQQSQQQQQPPQGHHVFPDHIANMAALVSGIVNLPHNTKESSRTISWAHPLIPTAGSIYPGGLFAGFDGMQMQAMNRPTNPIFQGFDFSSMKQQQAQSQPMRFLDDQPRDSIGLIGNQQRKDKQPMYTVDGNMVLPAGNLNSWTTDHESSNNPSTSNASIWTNNNGASNSNGLNDQSSFNPNQWPNIPDYDHDHAQ